MNTSNKNFPNPGLLAPWYDEAFECSFIRSCYMGTSDVPGELAPIMSMWRHDTPVFIQADTGTGKSTFVIRELYRHVVEHGGRLLVVSNRVALTVQYKAEMLRLYAPKQLKAFTAYGLQHQDHFEGLSAEFCSYQGFGPSPANTKRVRSLLLIMSSLMRSTFSALTASLQRILTGSAQYPFCFPACC